MLDIVAVAMFVIVPVMAWSIMQAKKGRYALHGKVQLGLGIVLLVAVVLFEVDIRINGWRHLAAESRFYGSLVYPVLMVHLFFAVSTTVLWAWTIIAAMRRFPWPPAPNAYSPLHRKLGLLAAIDMTCTAVTGWTFYVLACMC